MKLVMMNVVVVVHKKKAESLCFESRFVGNRFRQIMTRGGGDAARSCSFQTSDCLIIVEFRYKKQKKLFEFGDYLYAEPAAQILAAALAAHSFSSCGGVGHIEVFSLGCLLRAILIGAVTGSFIKV